MKYVIILGDGMADYPIPALDGKTPLEVAHTPYMDRIASEGTLGLIDTIPKGMHPGSDVANLSVLGYDPREIYTGRGPLEAASMGLNLSADDVAFRCNLVTLGPLENPIMDDFTSGHISSEESKEIIRSLNGELAFDNFQFFSGVGYRHLLVWSHGKDNLNTTPPHDITGKPFQEYLPIGEGSSPIIELMQRSQDILKNHPVNRRRIESGKKPANSIWLWGQGRAPEIIRLTDLYNIKGGMISAVDLLKGIGIFAGLKIIKVDGATGYTDTNYVGKAEQALVSLEDMDFIFIHVEAPDEMGHEGNIEGKVRSIEDFDQKVVGKIFDEIRNFGAFRIMVLSDHPTPISLKTHSSDPSPFAVLSSENGENLALKSSFSEASAKKSGIFISPGHNLMEIYLRGWKSFVQEKNS
jgi:2,3-bisphosphoglycerate-independent phosphoglycerate mutase